MINMLNLADKEGEVNIDKLIDNYTEFYQNRIDRNLQVDRNGCILLIGRGTSQIHYL